MNPSVKINCIELTWVESKEKLAEWENLLIESDFPHPFSSFTFYNAWVETFVDDLTQIKMLFFYNENNLVGLAPILIDHINKNVSILGKGENELAVDTPNDTKHPANRRAEVKILN